MVGGDKSENWTAWYEVNIPIADDRFDEHQIAIEVKRGGIKRAGARKTRSPER